MIISLTKLRELVPAAVNIPDNTLLAQLEGLESLIRAYTHNNFQARNKRKLANIVDGSLQMNCAYINPGDTIQISKSLYNDGVYTYAVTMELIDEPNVVVTKVEYPASVQNGVANMVAWEIENRSKVGIQSESLSRHSVTYFNLDGDNSLIGYPKSIVGFLKPYMKAQF